MDAKQIATLTRWDRMVGLIADRHLYFVVLFVLGVAVGSLGALMIAAEFFELRETAHAAAGIAMWSGFGIAMLTGIAISVARMTFEYCDTARESANFRLR